MIQNTKRIIFGSLGVLVLVAVLGLAVWRVQQPKTTLPRPKATGEAGFCVDPNTSFHLACGENKACVRKKGAGPNLNGCASVGESCRTTGSGVCLPPAQTHLACGSSGTCIRKVGSGSNTDGCTAVGSSCSTSQLFILSVTALVHGAVTGTAGGQQVVDCNGSGGQKTCKVQLASGTQVQLTVAPDSGYLFSGWGGDCSGIGNCNLTMEASKSVTATFIPPGGECGACGGNVITFPCAAGLTCRNFQASPISNQAGLCLKTDGNSLCGSCQTDSNCFVGMVCAEGKCVEPTNIHLGCSATTAGSCVQKVGSGSNTDGCTVAGGTCGTTTSEVNACWGNGGTSGKCYDCNGDGEVNILDFACFRAAYQKNVQ